MIDKDLIIRKQNDALIKLSILMMIADRDLHDQEYKKVIEIIEKHSMYKISEDEISALVSDVSFQREKIGIKDFSNELCSTLKSKEKQKLLSSKTFNDLIKVLMDLAESVPIK